MISIHTSTREVTIGAFVTLWKTNISIHTSTREVTAMVTAKRGQHVVFQSTLPQGK